MLLSGLSRKVCLNQHSVLINHNLRRSCALQQLTTRSPHRSCVSRIALKIKYPTGQTIGIAVSKPATTPFILYQLVEV